MQGKMVLETSLLVEYVNHTGSKKYKKLMKKFVFPFSTNKAQWVEARGFGLDKFAYDRLLPQLMNEAEKNDSLEMLASKSALKIILTEDEKKNLPYVHYIKGMINNQVTSTLSATECRDTLRTYLRYVM